MYDSDDSDESAIIGITRSRRSRNLDDSEYYSISMSDIPSVTGVYRTVDEIHVKRFEDRLSGNGIFVVKYSNSGKGVSIRRLSYMGKYMYISSLKETREIAIEDIVGTSTSGRKLTIETYKDGEITMKMPSVIDAVAFSNVLGLKE